MNKTQYSKRTDEPDIEVNNTSKRPFWQNPQLNLILYLLFIFASFHVWQQVQETRRLEIPCSAFLEHLENEEVAEAVVTDKAIMGMLKESDATTGQPRQFITVPLWDQELAEKLAARGVDTGFATKTTGSATFSSTGFCPSVSCSCSGAGWPGAWAAWARAF